MTADRLPAIALTLGEPAGIGPDLVAAIMQRSWPAVITVVGDPAVLLERAERLGLDLTHCRFDVLAVPCPHPVTPGQLDSGNAAAVVDMLAAAGRGCLDGRFDAMVTAPVQKSVINAAGIPFTGHTEFLAGLAGIELPVMMLVAGSLRVALMTTHLPLRAVADAITAERAETVIRILNNDLQQRFHIAAPRILVCGLNPHAGEDGHLGREEIEILSPCLERLRNEGLQLIGPIPADTAFTPRRLADVDTVLALYHDQGLPVLKHAGFGQAVNVTLGLPFIRTSVDHGTALDLAGTGRADPESLACALDLAIRLAGGSHSRDA